jgi:hypothetical protein
MASSKKQLDEIRIHLKGEGEDGEGFEVEHHFKQPKGMMGGYHEPESKGVFKHHGEVMDHVHNSIKDHGSEQEELSGGSQSADGESEEHDTSCVLCDHAGDGEKALKEAKVTNINQHGYEKKTVNDPKTSAKKHSAKHPGFKAVAKKIESKEHLSSKAASAILAARSRGASASAHKANPRLSRVS